MHSSLKNEILNFFVVKDKKKMSEINNDFSFRKILLNCNRFIYINY